MKPAILTGTRESEDGDAWTHWALLHRRQMSRAQVREVLRQLTQPAMSTDTFCRGSGGYWLTTWRARPEIKRRGHRILFRQSGGHDV